MAGVNQEDPEYAVPGAAAASAAAPLSATGTDTAVIYPNSRLLVHHLHSFITSTVALGGLPLRACAMEAC